MKMARMPQSLFARTAWLIGSTFGLYLAIVWMALGWAVIAPAARDAGHTLAARVRESLRLYQQQRPLPESVVLLAPAQTPVRAPFAGFVLSYYLESVRKRVEDEIPGGVAVIVRATGPSEIWVKTPALDGHWLRMTWEVARPEAPLAALFAMLGAAALGGLAEDVTRWQARLPATDEDGGGPHDGA